MKGWNCLGGDFRRVVVPAIVLVLVFVVLVAASSGSASAAERPPGVRPPWTSSRMKGTPDTPAPYKIVSAFPKVRFVKPTSIEEIPGANRLLITEIDGKIFSLAKRPDVEQADLLIDLRERLPAKLAGRSVSLFDAEFHPRFLDNRFLYVCYVHPDANGHTRVSQFKMTGDATAPKIVPDSEQVVITWPSGGHNGGCLEFGKDGSLYISTGDGSGPNPPDGLTTGQDVSDLLGAILRIDLDHAPDGQLYSVPADNPFVGRAGIRPEIWAYGLRNPWKFGIDGLSGETFVADNGWESWEMVHRIVRGGNCGWPVMEGRVALRTEVKVGPTPIRPPVKDHSHTEANSVIGGPVYRGTKLPDLSGSFVYGDYITGTIWSIHADSEESYSGRTLVDTDLRIVAFTQGSQGELFVLDYDFSGQIYELLPSLAPDNSANFPRRLSETGLFASLPDMEPSPGVVPYDVVVPRWMDGATGQRWVAIPGEGRIRLATGQDQPATYPSGTVFVKHLTLPQPNGAPRLPLETQILHYEDEVWHPYSYLWDDQGQDARLVESVGASRPIRFTDAKDGTSSERTWHVNATNECKLCHNVGPGFVLGFVANQLSHPAGKTGADQLVNRLAARGVLSPSPAVGNEGASRLVDPHDVTQSVDDRARSYLHVNCAMCHHPGGNAIVSFFLRRDLPFDKLNTNKGTGIGTFGMRDAKVIVPGDPYRSVLMYRMAKLGYGRMPYIGSRVVDGTGLALIEAWIRSLADDPGSVASAPVRSDSLESRATQRLASGKAATPAQRDAELGALVKTTEGTLALIGQLHRGKLDVEDSRAAIALGRAAPSSDLRGLFETFIPESQRKATLGSSIDPELVLSRQGDLERGKLIFSSDSARCRACHDVRDREKSIGPSIQEINKKYPKPGELLQHVFQPSLKVDEPFAAYALVTHEGQAINGLLLERTDQAVTLKTAEHKTVRIALDQIESLQRSSKSLMPEMILSDLTAQEAADLLAYLRSLGS